MVMKRLCMCDSLEQMSHSDSESRSLATVVYPILQRWRILTFFTLHIKLLVSVVLLACISCCDTQ